MIAFLKGTIVQITQTAVLLDVNNVGFRVFITTRDAQELPGIGEEVVLQTYLNVKEDAMQLYGFLDADDLEMYKLLLNVNGVGPKAGLSILSTLTADDIRFAVLSGDAKAIAKAPGIGAKTAQKMILELKDKVDFEESFEKKLEHSAGKVQAPSNHLAASEAIQALSALGYSNSDAMRAVRKLTITEDMDAGQIIKLALKQMVF